MAENISGFGLRVTLKTGSTFPSGVTISQFADDNDPLDGASQQIADKGMGLNGDLVTWSKANPIVATLNVIADSADDKNLAAIFNANRPGRGKRAVNEKIQAVFSYPDGTVVTVDQGAITDGMPFTGISSSGRKKSKTYVFSFENVVSA